MPRAGPPVRFLHQKSTKKANFDKVNSVQDVCAASESYYHIHTKLCIYETSHIHNNDAACPSCGLNGRCVALTSVARDH